MDVISLNLKRPAEKEGSQGVGCDMLRLRFARDVQRNVDIGVWVTTCN